MLLAVTLGWPTVALYVKRWHDRGKSGWWTLLLLFPVIWDLWVTFECGFFRGDQGPNKYGEKAY
jgi:uncharacterized membrane protein YhaH (DUF805 family)